MAENDLSFGRRFSRLVGLSNHHKIIVINTYFWSNRSKSFDKVQIRICPFHVLDYHSSMNAIGVYETRCEKIGLRGFRPGPTQTGLYSHRRWLEA